MAKRRVCDFMVPALIRMARLTVGLATVLAANAPGVASAITLN